MKSVIVDYEEKQRTLLVLFSTVLGLVTILVLSLLPSKPSKEFLTALVNAAVQLLAFGGVIFGIYYTAQRSLVVDLDKMYFRWSDWHAKNPQDEKANKRLTAINMEIERKQYDYNIAGKGFALSFVLWALCILISLAHLASFDTINMEFGLLFLELEILLVSIGLGSFLYVMVKNAVLPIPIPESSAEKS